MALSVQILRVSHVPFRVRHPVIGGDYAAIDKDHLNVSSADPILPA